MCELSHGAGTSMNTFQYFMKTKKYFQHISQANGLYRACLFQVGRWAVDNSTGKRCLSSCTRQENHVQISYYKFPNKMFLNSEDIIKLIKKLGVACNPQIKIYGPKRPLLDAQYPKLCPFFDQISNEDLAADVDASFTVHHFFKGLNLSNDELATLKEQLLAYASDNLAKINAFLDSPYLSKYQTDEVSVLMLPLNLNHI